MAGFDSKLTSQVDNHSTNTNTSNSISDGNINAGASASVNSTKNETTISGIDYNQTYNLGLQGNDLMNVVAGVSGTAQAMVQQATNATAQGLNNLMGNAKGIAKYIGIGIGVLVFVIAGILLIKRRKK